MTQATRLFIFAILSLSVAACTSSGSGSDRVVNDGTTDTGGGNGYENKVYERYIVDPTQLESFKIYLQPMVDQLSRMGSQADPKATQLLLKKWLFYKAWYIAPVKLDSISKDVLGVSFSQDKSEQLALQTKKSIWINNARFNRMTKQDQAALILHEAMMSLFFLKHKSWTDVCREKLIGNNTCRPEEIPILEQMWPGSEPAPLTAGDYENIRAVVGRLLTGFALSSPEQVTELLMTHDFDARFTPTMGLSMDPGGTQYVRYKTSILIDMPTLKSVFDAAPILGRIPDTCTGMKFKKSMPCPTKLRFELFGQDVYSLELGWSSNDGGLHAQSQTYYAGQAYGASVEFVAQGIGLMYVPVSITLEKPVAGQAFRSHMAVLFYSLKQDRAPMKLLGFQSIPGVITNPDSCRYDRPLASSILNDVIFLAPKAASEFEMQLLNVQAAGMPPAAFCH